MLYTCCGNGTPWSMPTSKDVTATCTDTSENCSKIFRVEKLEGNCATFRVLVATVNDGVTTYTATDSLFTINLNCVCVLKCLNDTYIECI